jgi:hypothetical protein
VPVLRTARLMRKRLALRRGALRRVDVRAADVADAFLRLTSTQKANLICEVPELYFAVARLVRMREIAAETRAAA